VTESQCRGGRKGGGREKRQKKKKETMRRTREQKENRENRGGEKKSVDEDDITINFPFSRTRNQTEQDREWHHSFFLESQRQA